MTAWDAAAVGAIVAALLVPPGALLVWGLDRAIRWLEGRR